MSAPTVARDTHREAAAARQRESHVDVQFRTANRTVPAARDDRESRPRHAPVRGGDEVPAWFVWASLVLVAGPSFAALAWFQHELFAAAWPGAPWGITLSLAIGVDSFGAMAGVYWFRSKRNEALRAWGRFFAIAAVLGTTTLMCTAIHRLFPGWEALGVIPAVIVFGTTKLVTMWQADRATGRDVAAAVGERTQAVERERDELARLLADERALRAELVAEQSTPAGPTEGPSTEPIAVPERTRPAPGARVASIRARSKTEQGRQFVLDHIARHGEAPTGAQVDAAVGGRSTGRAVLKKMRDAGELPAPA